MHIASGKGTEDFPGNLSSREAQVLLLASEGRTDKAAASEMGISLATVGTYWDRIRTKSEMSSRAEIVTSYWRRRCSNVEETLNGQSAMKLAVESSPVGIFLTDISGEPVFKNKVASHLISFGGTATPAPILFPIGRPEADNNSNLCTRGPDYVLVSPYLTSEDATIWIRLCSSEFLQDGANIGRVGTVEDVTLSQKTC